MRTLLLLLLSCSTVYSILQLRKLSYLKFPYTTSNAFGYLRDAAHRAAYHAQERILYVLGGQTAANQARLLWIVDLNNPASPQILHTHSFDPVENGRANDIAVCPDTVAVTLESSLATKEGHIEFFAPFRRGNLNLVRLGREPVGVDPKGLAFTADCQKLVIANEGRGGQDPIDQKFVDPPGSVTIMLRNDLGNPSFVNINFEPFLTGREFEYQTKGVRWVYKGNHNQGIINNMWDDLEPERVTIDRSERFAYVTLPENNAIARIDLNAFSVNDIFPLGYKDWSTLSVDGSDQDGGPNFVSGFPVQSLFNPTDVMIIISNNQEYLLTANQGTIKRYTAAQGDEFDESRRARTVAVDMEFDESMWPAAVSSAVRNNAQLGRLLIRHSDAADAISRLIKNVTAYGGRSLTLWTTQTLTRYYDTLAEIEQHEFTTYATTFNGETSNANQSPAQQRDLRSDDHGPEPTCVSAGYFSATVPMVVTGTRTGCIHVYTEIQTVPTFQSVHREGGTTQPWNTLYTSDTAGDAAITDIGVISYTESPNGSPLVWVIGSATGSLGVYQVVNQ